MEEYDLQLWTRRAQGCGAKVRSVVGVRRDVRPADGAGLSLLVKAAHCPVYAFLHQADDGLSGPLDGVVSEFLVFGGHFSEDPADSVGARRRLADADSQPCEVLVAKRGDDRLDAVVSGCASTSVSV